MIFIGGIGPKAVFYGTVFSGGSLVVSDYSANQDMKVESPVLPTTNVDGTRTYRRRRLKTGLGFRVSGSVYRLTVTGSSSLNALGVYGRVQLRGKGTLSVDGARIAGTGPPSSSRRSRRRSAPSGTGGRHAALPAPPAQPVPPAPPATTTTRRSAADRRGRERSRS